MCSTGNAGDTLLWRADGRRQRFEIQRAVLTIGFRARASSEPFLTVGFKARASNKTF
jgi:hypothetical protein